MKRKNYSAGLKGYERYSKLYDDAAARLRKRGLEMYSPKLNKAEFDMRKEAYSDYYKEKGKIVKDITEDMIRNQKFELSKDEAAHLRKIMIEAGDRTNIPSVTRIREGGFTSKDLTDKEWKYLGSQYDLYKEQGMSAVESKGLIAYTYFGSE